MRRQPFIGLAAITLLLASACMDSTSPAEAPTEGQASPSPTAVALTTPLRAVESGPQTDGMTADNATSSEGPSASEDNSGQQQPEVTATPLPWYSDPAITEVPPENWQETAIAIISAQTGIPPESLTAVFAGRGIYRRVGEIAYTIQVTGSDSPRSWYVFLGRSGEQVVRGEIQAQEGALENQERAAFRAKYGKLNSASFFEYLNAMAEDDTVMISIELQWPDMPAFEADLKVRYPEVADDRLEFSNLVWTELGKYFDQI